MRLVRSLAAVATVVLAGALSAQPRHVAGKISVRWLGHAGFEVVSPGGTRLLIDPWLSGNPSAPDSLKPAARWSGANKPAAILISHSHFDHAGDTKALAQASGAPVVGAFEWVNTLGLPEGQAMGGNVGGTMQFGDVTVHLVPAMHSSDPGGRPLGFVLTFADGRSLYHTGDTWVFGDMALIQERYHPSILLLGVGGGPYTEDAATAAFAVKKYFTPTAIIPMHYATFPALNTEAQVRAAFKGDARLAVMKPGETRAF
ncbi:MAG: metal-dependent hydrolase [Gemmatimonadetes bacterium]|nr:metal-dependent hydrolase [Gemmatimonadota bacterium]MBI3569052.1 metal-dependent hydrolase [Gemmatimonadota bacterium]